MASCGLSSSEKNLSIADVRQYMNSFTTFKASFQQYSLNDQVSTGFLYISKPRYMQWVYESPQQIVINVNGLFTTYYDKELDHAVNLPTDNILWDMLHNNYTSSHFYCENNKGYLKIDKGNKGNGTLQFSSNPIALEKMEVVYDNYHIVILFHNIEYDPLLSNRIFTSFN